MADQISIRLDESIVSAGSAVTATVNFRTRSTAAASTPSSIRYRVDCLTTKKAIVEWTSVSAASSASIVVPGTLNAIVSTSNDVETRQITVEIDTELSTQARWATTWKVRNISTYADLMTFPTGLLLDPYYAADALESALTIEHYQYPHGHRFRYLDTFDVLDAHYYRITAAETAALVTPVNFGIPELHVDRYGADNTGAADSAVAFNAAADVALATQRTGAEVIMGYGTYKLSSLVTVTGHILFRGQGMNATRINLGNTVNGFKFVNSPATNEIEGGGLVDCSISHDAATIVIECVDVWGLKFERIFFRDGGTGSGRLIKGSGECFEMRIRDCRMLGANTYCIDLIANSNSSIIEGNDFAPNNGCTAIRIQTAGDCVIRANRFEYAGSDTGVKVEVDAAKNTIICENDITQGTSGYAVVFKGDCDGGKVHYNEFSTSGSAGCIDVQNGDYGVIGGNTFWISSTSGDQIKAGGRTGWTVNANTFRVDAALAVAANLILLDTSATDWAIIGNECVGEGSGANGGTGIQIDAGCTQIKVIGNGFNNLNTGIDTQANNASPSVVIEGNSFTTLTTKITIGTAASNRIRNNLGYVSEAEGATSVADGGTITHGLSGTPTNVRVTPSTSGEFVSVTAIGATTFTAAIKKHDNTAGTTQTLNWEASI